MPQTGISRTPLIPPSAGSAGGLVMSFSATDSANGMKVLNDGRTFVLFKNTSGAPITVTPQVVQTVPGATITSQALSVPAGGEALLGPLDPTVYNQTGSDAGYVYLACSTSTGLTQCAFYVP